MASSNIKLFDENKGNMLSDSEFSISNQRMNGLQTGVASSQLQNKAMYQASLVAYAIAQIMMQNGKNANDTDAVSAFVANLSGTMLQKVYDIATTAEAQAGVATGKWMSPALVKAAIDTLAAKAQNILSDETKALYGLGANAVPDDAFSLLSRFNKGLGNEYLWRKNKVTYPENSETLTNVTFTQQTNNGSNASVSFAKSFTSKTNGNYTLSGIQSKSFLMSEKFKDFVNFIQTAKGCYFTSSNWLSCNSTSTNTQGIYYIPSDATIKVSRSGYINTINISSIVHFWGKTEQTDNYGYVNSPDPNAYPPAVPDGYTYTALGQLGNMAQIATGSYIGTGTYGNSNPNTLTFNFKPKYVLIYGTLTSGRNGIIEYVFPCLFLTNVYTQYAYTYLSNTNEYNWAKVDENTLSWYSSVNNASNAQNQQANNNDYTYYYIAIG